MFIAGVGYVLIGKTAETLPAREDDYSLGSPTNFNSWGERRVMRSVIGATSSDSHEP